MRELHREQEVGELRPAAQGPEVAACDPDAAPRPNEGLSGETYDPTCPPGMVRSADVCIDRYEAALVELDIGRTHLYRLISSFGLVRQER